MTGREWISAVGNGPFIGVMIFILAITAGAVLFAQYCIGDRGFMRTGYDFEGYVIRKCAVCVGTGIPRRTNPHVQETGPLEEVEVQVVEEVRASEPPTTPAPVANAAPAAPPPPAAAVAAAAEVAVAVPAAAKEEEEDEDDEDMMEDDGDDGELLFEGEEDALDL